MTRAVKREPSSNPGVGPSELRPVKRERLTRTNGGGAGPPPLPPQQDAVERRILRSKYLAIHNKINDERDDLTRVDSDKFDSIIKEVEDLHQLVQKPREQVADAEALLDIARTLVSSVKSQSNEGITPADFISCLLSEFGQSTSRADNEDVAPMSIKWRDVGLAVSPIFMKCNGLSTMVGPMNTELKQRKVPVQRRRHTKPTESARPEVVDDTQTEEKTDTDKNMSTMFEVLRSKKRVQLEHLILNRRSFAQTVENLFALSFLVKDGRVEVKVDDSGSHIISPKNAPAANSVMSGEVAYRHFVFRFDFKDWKQMMNLVKEGEELMPFRESANVSEAERPAYNYSQGTQSRTPIRKLSRNRGLVIDEGIVSDSPENDDASLNAAGLLRCKRKLT